MEAAPKANTRSAVDQPPNGKQGRCLARRARAILLGLRARVGDRVRQSIQSQQLPFKEKSNRLFRFPFYIYEFSAIEADFRQTDQIRLVPSVNDHPRV